jgi:hypothetical protein
MFYQTINAKRLSLPEKNRLDMLGNRISQGAEKHRA